MKLFTSENVVSLLSCNLALYLLIFTYVDSRETTGLIFLFLTPYFLTLKKGGGREIVESCLCSSCIS